jgi:hypothetical protein
LQWAVCLTALRCYGNLFGNRPPKTHQLTSNGHDHLVGMFASGDQCSIAFTPPYLGFPTDVLDGFGLFFQAQLQVATDLGWVAIGPRSFDEAPSRFGKKRGGDDPAYVSFFGQVAIEPRAAGAGFVDKDAMFAFGEEDALKQATFC